LTSTNPEFQRVADQQTKISFLAPNIGGPSLGFATAFARALATRFPVEVIGPDFWGSGVMPIYRDQFPYTVVPTPRLYRYPEYWWQMRRLQRAITGQVVFAVKATPQTVRVALREKRRRGTPVVVCLDEWDGGPMAQRTSAERRALWRKHWMHPLEGIYYPAVERLLPQADLIVSTSTFLQRKFGGIVVRMGADTDRFQPVPSAEKTAIRASLGLGPEHRVIVFGGVVRPHKGVETILEAVRLAADPLLRLLVIGPLTDTLSEFTRGPVGSQMITAGPKPADEMPRWLGAGDLVVLPMTTDLLAQSQVPCKVFEAMAMGLPVIAGAVSDLPDIVSGAGAIFAPGDAVALQAEIQTLFSDSSRLAALGRAARQKCIQKYSFSIMAQELISAINALN